MAVAVKNRKRTVATTASKNGHNGNGHVRVPKYVTELLKRVDDGVVRLDIGGGPHPQPGFLVMDIQPLPGVHIVHDWDVYPWPLPDNSVAVILASHVVEHVDPARNGFIKWMDECWRILKFEGQLIISCPYAGSPGDFGDPTHCNHVTHHTWRYFDPLAPQDLYKTYKPKPWKIALGPWWNVDGVMEVTMEKRRPDPEGGYK